jgi:two-component system nitrate/nitrite response regulator NarL
VAAGKELVLVVDDDRGYRALARTLLERAGFTVAEAANADEALAAAEEDPPQLVLLDVQLPRVSGYAVYRELRDRHGEDLPIMFVSGKRTEAYDRTVGLLLGAEDYLVKPFDPDELVARVRRSVRRRTNGASGNGVPGPDVMAELTPREREVLSLLAAGRSSAQIARELVISPRTLGTHVQHILSKLGVHNRTQAVALAHRAGFGTPEVQAHALVAGEEPERSQAATRTSEASRLAS